MIHIDSDNLKNGILGLVLAVVEILRDALQNQATRRIDSGTLSGDEVERLGVALADLDRAIEGIKREQGLGQAVQSVRDELDDIVNDVVQRVIDPSTWKDCDADILSACDRARTGSCAAGVSPACVADVPSASSPFPAVSSSLSSFSSSSPSWPKQQQQQQNADKMSATHTPVEVLQ